jgi:hypothetical protein
VPQPHGSASPVGLRSPRWIRGHQRRRASSTTLRDKFIKIGAKVVSHGRHVVFSLAEVAVPQELFRQILQRIRHLDPIPDTGWP